MRRGSGKGPGAALYLRTLRVLKSEGNGGEVIRVGVNIILIMLFYFAVKPHKPTPHERSYFRKNIYES